MKGAEVFTQQVWLLNTIYREKSISLAEINYQWTHTEMSGGAEMSRYTFFRYKNAIEETFGIIIACDRKTNKYYISNPRLLRDDSVQRWMLSTITVSDIISESLSLQDHILLENIPIEGNRLATIVEAMKEQRRIAFCYQKYSDAQPSERIATPCCIKLFRQRWYVVDYNTQTSSRPFKTFAFDRMSKLHLTDERFELPPSFRASDIFADSFGIFIDDVERPERVVIRAYGSERFYMRDLPLHSSQEVVGEGDGYTDYRFFIRPSTDFMAELLSKGDRVEVVAPASLREKMREAHLKAARRYEN